MAPSHPQSHVPPWGTRDVLRRQVRELLGAQGLGWVVGVAAAVPGAAVAAGAGACRLLGIAAPGPVLLRLWFLAAIALVGPLTAAYGASAIAGRAEAGVLDAMRRHGVAVGAALAGKLGAVVALGLALAAATLPAALLGRAFGPFPAHDAAVALLGLGLVAVLGASVGIALGARIGTPRPALVAAAGVMALVPAALAAYARFAPALLLGRGDWAALALFGADPAARHLAVTAQLAALPLLAAAGALGLCRALATSALLPRDADRLAPVRRWIPSALVLAAAAAAVVRL